MQNVFTVIACVEHLSKVPCRAYSAPAAKKAAPPGPESLDKQVCPTRRSNELVELVKIILSYWLWSAEKSITNNQQVALYAA